ncbi:MAG: butyrate kinase [Proteobacteria bacterium]|nr:MAG: butyrate kinase [Pseudomonadota bacterium]
MALRILVINPGSTSTKTALFSDERELARDNISHRVEELAAFARVGDQLEMRKTRILAFLARQGHAPAELSAVVGRGGLLAPIEGGTYRVNEAMLRDLHAAERGEHASNLGAIIAHAIAQPAGKPAFIVDPVVVDELAPPARLSGLAGLPRVSIFHALNHKSVARQAAATLGKDYGACHLVVAHLGGGISVGAHASGRVIDVNQALNGEGCFSPERAGTLPSWDLAQLAFEHADGAERRKTLQKMICGKGGLVSYLGTNDLREAWARADSGDEQAHLVIEAMAWQISKDIGAMAAVLGGRVDAVVLTGGLAHDQRLTERIRQHVGWIGEVLVVPGEAEMEALCEGALRVLRGEERARAYEPETDEQRETISSERCLREHLR